jgi:UPF0755 protein
MSPFSKTEYSILTLIFLIIVISVFSSRIYRLYYPGAVYSENGSVILLYEHSTLEELASLLAYQDIEINIDEMMWAGHTLGWRNFRPGRYEFSGKLSQNDFLSKLARGLQDPARVTILPGMDKERLSSRLSVQLRADSVDFRSVFSDSSEVALEAGLSGEELFSRMIPNSYDFYWTTSAENVARRILAEFDRVVTKNLAEEIENHPLTLDEIIILASIVEWEARHNEEKPRISGLYLNRLNRNMMLQADPTVNYALGERRRLLFEDYQVDHPYNTYRIHGLPPGPITNPDLASILSVLRPEDHDYLFMVATPEGTHSFSRTFEEHRRASEVWRRWLREQYRIRDQRMSEEDV